MNNSVIKKAALILCLILLVLQAFPIAGGMKVAHAMAGSGTSADPFIIMTPQELSDIRNNLSASYKLGADIDLARYDYGDGGGWMPIGPDFAGTLDGNGYVIRNLTLNRPSLSNSGLFGSASGTLNNIQLLGVNIVGDWNTGGLVGSLRTGGAVENCFVNAGAANNIHGSRNVGGLVGYNGGAISSSYAIASVGGEQEGEVGGVTGFNIGPRGNVSNSFSNSSVSGLTNIGGIAGVNSDGMIKNVYAVGSVNGSRNPIGGLVGTNVGAPSLRVFSSYWDASMATTSQGGTPTTNEDMKKESTYAGWDFNGVWGIREGATYPYLVAFKPSLRVSLLAQPTYKDQLPVIGTVLDGSIGEQVEIRYDIKDSSNVTVKSVTSYVYASGTEQAIDRIIPLTGLPDGLYSISIQAIDTYNPAYTAAPLSFTIDATPPSVQFSPNGSTQPAKTAAAVVNVTDTPSGVNASSLQYAWTQDTAVPSSGWAVFKSGDTLPKAGRDGNWYLHIRAADTIGNVADMVSNAFVLDNTAPTATVSSLAGSTVNAPFPITITFSEPVTGLSVSGIVASNATVSNLTSVSASKYTATVTPLTSGQPVNIHVAANAAADASGNGNTASAAASFFYDTTKPTVAFAGFVNHERFTVPPTTISVTVSEAVYWLTGGAQLNAANALPLISMEKDGVTFSTYSASYDNAARTFTLRFNSTLGDGTYVLNIAGNAVMNARHNTLDAASASFTVAVPVITNLTVNPASYTHTGGSATVTITGSNLTGQAIAIYLDGAAAAAANISSSTSAAATVTIPPNMTANDQTHNLKVYLNGVEVSGKSATVTVARVPSSNADLSSLSLSAGTLTPTFSPGTTSYDIQVANSVSSTTVTPSVHDSNATTTVNGTAVGSGQESGAIGLDVGSTPITIVVTAQDGTTKTYTVHVLRVSSSSHRGGSASAAPLPAIDLNGSMLDLESIDLTKPSVTLEVTPKEGTAEVSIPASILKSFEGKNASFFIEIQTPYGSYQIPVHLASLIPGLTDLLAKNNLSAEDIHFKITLTDKSGDKNMKAAMATQFPHGQVMGAVVDFHIDIMNTKTGQSIGTADQFSNALTRVIPMPRNVTVIPEQWGAFRYNETAKSFEFVAARMVKMNGIWVAMISSYSNSVYAVVQNAPSFSDVEQHWSKPFVELAAAKGLVEGVGGGQYAPDNSVTRAQFTAMLVRALGRGTAGGSTAPYTDVKPDAWYFSSVSKAQELGLLGFVKGQSFMPNQPLTREEMASMLAAVTKLEKGSADKGNDSLKGYKDWSSVDADLLDAVRLMVTLQVMTGTEEGTFSPKGETTRAQAAVVYIRLLRALGMMD